jgi:ribosomal protein S18 acetylase RimI-like enzyme
MDSAPEHEIRRAVEADIPALAELGAATFVEAFAHLYSRADCDDFLASSHSPGAYRRILAQPGVAVWLAARAGEAPGGYAVAGPCKLPVPDLEPRAGEVQRVYVRAALHGRQIGTRLLETALDWLAAAGHAPLYVGVWSENYGAQRLYGRYGFRKVGEYEFPVGRQLDREFILTREP